MEEEKSVPVQELKRGDNMVIRFLIAYHKVDHLLAYVEQDMKNAVYALGDVLKKSRKGRRRRSVKFVRLFVDRDFGGGFAYLTGFRFRFRRRGIKYVTGNRNRIGPIYRPVFRNRFGVLIVWEGYSYTLADMYGRGRGII